MDLNLEHIDLSIVDKIMYLPDFLEIRYSKIKGAGLGIFAKRLIKKGKFLGNYVGEMIKLEEYTKLVTNPYLFNTKVFNENYIIDGSFLEKSNWTRYMNCSCNKEDENVFSIKCENEEVYSVENHDQFETSINNICLNGKIVFYTSRAIETGEELMFDYGENYKTLWNIS